MNTHKNARLTYLRRLEMVQDITLRSITLAAAASLHGVSSVTARKWLGRYLAHGAAGLLDKSSRPARSPRAIDPGVALAIVELRRKLLLQAHIASSMGVSKATVSRVLRRAGLSRLSDLRPQEPIQRYERASAGELLQIDIKKLGRFTQPGHRVSGDRRKRDRRAGWEYLYVAVDDHSRIAFTKLYPDERQHSAGSFLSAARAYFAKLHVPIQRVLTDNGPAFHSRAFVEACRELGIEQKFTRIYRPQTNGKAERFIQSALREWAYGRAYQHCQQRQDAHTEFLTPPLTTIGRLSNGLPLPWSASSVNTLRHIRPPNCSAEQLARYSVLVVLRVRASPCMLRLGYAILAT